ncbi:hypothetical protein QQF64_019520, partial [Cirrhinus molitorella]
VSAAERNQVRHAIDGESVTLESGETTGTNYSMTWYFDGLVITGITRDQNKACTDDQSNNGTEQFRDRVKLNADGSLNIINVNIADSGLYQQRIVISKNSFCITRLRRFKVAVFFPAAGICVVVVFLLMAATITGGVIYCRQKKIKPQLKKMGMMLISRRRIRKTLLKGFGMTLNQTQDEGAYKMM